MRRVSLDDLVRCSESRIVCTGGIVFIGDGNAGKTHTALNLAHIDKDGTHKSDISDLRKSVNLEFNYFVFHSNIEEYQITTSSQLYIMPGQKGRGEKGHGLAFEDAVDLYFDVASISNVLVLVLTFDLTDMKTFQELEYWLEKAIERDFIHNYTSIIILGTHADLKDKVIVTPQNMADAKKFTQKFVLNKIGLNISLRSIYPIIISNKTGEGINKLKDAIFDSFMHAFQINDRIQKKEK